MYKRQAEWTSSPFDYYRRTITDRDAAGDVQRRIVRGGSWYDRPEYARSGYRASYWPYQQVYDVGFRVVCESDYDSTSPITVPPLN